MLKVRNRNELVIFLYHGVVRSPLKVQDWCFIDESSFRYQMKYIKKHFEILPLIDASELLRKEKIYCPTAAITFDDGLQNNYDLAYPILREDELPATIFLTTGLLNSDDTLWYCRLNRGLSNTTKDSLEWNGTRFDLDSNVSKAKSSSLIQKKLKQFPHPQLLDQLRRILIGLGDDPDCPVEAGSPYGMLSHDAIREMIDSGLVEFGAHTQSHAILSLISQEERYREIKLSVDAVRELTDRPCRLFAYPNGRRQDYDTEAMKILKSCGIDVSVTAIEGINYGMTPIMELKRFGVGADLSLGQFKQKLDSLLT